MKHLFLVATLAVAATFQSVGTLAATAATELQGLQILSFPLTTKAAPICTFKAVHSGTLLFIGNGVDAPLGGAKTTYEVYVSGVFKRGWSFGNLNIGYVGPIKAGQTFQVYGKYSGGAGATLTSANFSAVIAPQ